MATSSKLQRGGRGREAARAFEGPPRETVSLAPGRCFMNLSSACGFSVPGRAAQTLGAVQMSVAAEERQMG